MTPLRPQLTKSISQHVYPDLENTYYMLSTEILGENGQVEDTVVTKIYVPETE